jgi:hypothetical protein
MAKFIERNSLLLLVVSVRTYAKFAGINLRMVGLFILITITKLKNFEDGCVIIAIVHLGMLKTIRKYFVL